MSGYSILIVDDEPDNFDAIEALLPGETYQLHYASSGEHAIASLDKFDPDVILMDVMMPVLNGIETCKRIKLMSQWQNVPIIMVTALSSKEDLARCLAAGADDFLSKPVNGLELRARVNSMLRLKKQHDRVRALSKLQRNNINFLANSLNEIHLDLSVGFPDEFSTPLGIAEQNIDFLLANIQTSDIEEINRCLTSSKQSLSHLQRLTEKFWFYLQLTLESQNVDGLEISNPQEIIKQILASEFSDSSLPSGVSYEIKDGKLAVGLERARWIFREIFAYIFSIYRPNQDLLRIDSNVIDESFHFSVSISPADRSVTDRMTMADLIQFNPLLDDNRDLGIGLKIVKKLVEIYDGIFLISDRKDGNANDSDSIQNTHIYITLPLIPDLSSHLARSHSVAAGESINTLQSHRRI